MKSTIIFYILATIYSFDIVNAIHNCNTATPHVVSESSATPDLESLLKRVMAEKPINVEGSIAQLFEDIKIVNAIDNNNTALRRIVSDSSTSPELVSLLKRIMAEKAISVEGSVVQLLNNVKSLIDAARSEGKNADHCFATASVSTNEMSQIAHKKERECLTDRSLAANRKRSLTEEPIHLDNPPINGLSTGDPIYWNSSSFIALGNLSLDCKRHAVSELKPKLEAIYDTAKNCIDKI